MSFVFVAAHLLHGATETPSLDSLPVELRERFTAPEPQDWAEWKRWHAVVAVYCERWVAYAYPEGGDRPTQCRNCLAELNA